MQTAKFWGSSDDLIEVEGVKGGDEFLSESNSSNELIAGVFNLGGLVRIYAIYDACWSFAVSKVDEDIPLPNWVVKYSECTENKYSMCLEIFVPDSVKLFRERLSE